MLVCWLVVGIPSLREEGRAMSGAVTKAAQSGRAAGSGTAAHPTRLHPVSWPGPVKAWLCIHRFEGSWTDTGWPHWGGLQMDESFMRTYGLDFIRRHRGFADRWSPREQMVAANRARVGVDWRGDSWPGVRGFTPWPRTARMCGLR